MITIGKPFVEEDGDQALVKAKVVISADTVQKYMGLKETVRKTRWRLYEDYPPKAWEAEDSGLYFSVAKEYRAYLAADRSDAFVVAMLWYAFMTSSDISFEAPISEKLYFGITQLLIPAVCKKLPPIRLLGPTTNAPAANEGAVGTGMSCGVDSLYTLNKFTADGVPDSYKLTHLAYFNMGAIYHPNNASGKQYEMDEFNREIARMSLEKRNNAKAVADEHHMPLVYIESNVDRDYYRGAYGYTAVYRNCACVLALEGLFGKYYCSSAGWPEFFDLSLTEGSEHYETLLCDAFSTESLQFIISDYATRLEKTAALADDKTAQKHLDVCLNFNNCGTCNKCRRTLVTLDILGKVDSFSEVFDIPAYRRDRDNAFAWLLETLDGDALNDHTVFAKDIYALLRERNVEIPPNSYRIYRKQKRQREPLTPRRIAGLAKLRLKRMLGK